MGHYDDCYAADYANEQEKNITIGDIKKLEKRVVKEGYVHGYWDDAYCTLMALIARKSDKLQVINASHKDFNITLKTLPEA